MKNKKILSPLLLILFLAGVLLLILGLILNGRDERTGNDTEKKEAELACFLENSKGRRRCAYAWTKRERSRELP